MLRRSPFDRGDAPYGRYEGPRHSARNWRKALEEAATASGAAALLGADDPWEVLGVPRSAGREEARRAFKKLVREHHPDAGGDPALCERAVAAWTAVREARGW